MRPELLDAVDHLLTYGYCVLEDRLPSDKARTMAVDFLELHADPAHDQHKIGDTGYETLFGMLNYDDRVWDCAFHPDAVAIARHFLGERCRVVEACCKPCWPGAPGQWPLHADSAGEFAQVPDVPWMVNSIWMLTDFTVENGATRIVPMSHHSRLRRPPADLTSDDPSVKSVTGSAGSVVLWHAGLLHGAGPNASVSDVRVGLNVAYYPRWLNNWIEGGHQPLWPETYARLPDEFQSLVVGKRGTYRADEYEVDR